MKRTHRKILFAVLAALLLTAGCGDGDDADTPPAVEYKVMGGRLVWCSGGAEDMAVPGNASSIGNNAFSNCGSIGTLTIPASVTHIMRYTFSGVKVGKIIFGGTVGEWADMAEQDGFGETLRATPVICSDGEWKWTAPAVPDVPVTPNDWQITDGVLIKYSGSAVSVTIPNGVTKIEAGAIPSGTTVIFHGMREEWETLAANSDLGGLTAFAVDEGTLVGYHEDRTDVVIPDVITTIAGGAFAGHTEVEHIVIPAGVTDIASGAFAECTGLTSIDIPASVTDIGAGALPAGTAVTYYGTAEQWDELAKDGGLDGVTVQFTDETGTPAHTHTWGEAYTNGGEDGHYRTCTDCGAHSETVPHGCETRTTPTAAITSSAPSVTQSPQPNHTPTAHAPPTPTARTPRPALSAPRKRPRNINMATARTTATVPIARPAVIPRPRTMATHTRAPTQFTTPGLHGVQCPRRGRAARLQRRRVRKLCKPQAGGGGRHDRRQRHAHEIRRGGDDAGNTRGRDGHRSFCIQRLHEPHERDDTRQRGKYRVSYVL